MEFKANLTAMGSKTYKMFQDNIYVV